jgi:hypothetical protein
VFKNDNTETWFATLAENLKIKDASRVTKLLQLSYGIYANSTNYTLWGVWANAALDTNENYNGLCVKYLENCKPYHELEIGDYKLFCCHSAPNPKGVQLNWFDTDNISSTSFPIQRIDLNVNNAPKYMCNSRGCACKGKTIRDQDIIGKYEAYITRATEKAPRDNEEILKLISLATGVRQDTELTLKDSTKKAEPEYEAMNCFFSTDGILTQENLDKCFIVHGHQPFGIPYTTPVTINESFKFKRVCVDVSIDGNYSGNFPDNKNWAYVTFSSKSKKFKTVGMCKGIHYTVDDLTKLTFSDKEQTINDIPPNFKTKVLSETLTIYPYEGIEADKINKPFITKLEPNTEPTLYI